ncbi:MAG: CHAP domain-containing protein [Caulobacteraceae bacterium]|nr:CHAP domain-containing protein [Caulobacteraceae bacterium]
MLKRLAVALVAAVIGFSPLAPQIAQADAPYWQCVTFARLTSGIEIRGDAWTWWQSAQGQYRTGSSPEVGSVLVFRPTGRMTRGHVAVVSEILTDRVIRITHANWGGSRGKIEENVTVADVSDAGDWSAVKVWYAPINDLGSSVYPVYGFIHNERLGGSTLIASLPTWLG